MVGVEVEMGPERGSVAAEADLSLLGLQINPCSVSRSVRVVGSRQTGGRGGPMLVLTLT